MAHKQKKGKIMYIIEMSNSVKVRLKDVKSFLQAINLELVGRISNTSIESKTFYRAEISSIGSEIFILEIIAPNIYWAWATLQNLEAGYELISLERYDEE